MNYENKSSGNGTVRSFDRLFQELYPDHYRPSGNSLCPFHEDTNPSFQIDATHGYCHAGCMPPSGRSSWDAVDLYQARHGCDRQTAVRQLGQKQEAPSPSAQSSLRETFPWDEAQVFDYTDVNGRLLYQVGRIGSGKEKRVNQRRPHPETHGQWIYGLHGIQRVIFRLPEVVRADQIWIPEGEKNVLDLEKIGFVATTNPQGARQWKCVCQDGDPPVALKGRAVYILPDNDQPGREHAQDIARNLRGFARSVKVIELPHLPEKGDVSDFIAQHGLEEAKRRLLEFAEETSEWTPPADVAECREHRDKPVAREKPKPYEILLGLLDDAQAVFFQDQFKAPWARVRIGDHYENMRIKSDGFLMHLISQYYEATGGICWKNTYQQVQDLCSAKANVHGLQQTLSYRAAWQNKSILIDMGTAEWSAIEVSAAGHMVVNLEKPPFKRFPHMRALPTPEAGGRLADIFDLIPISETNSRVLLEAWIACALIPDIPRPGILLTGTQGSGKTFVCEVLRELIDPSVTGTLSLPRSESELIH